MNSAWLIAILGRLLPRTHREWPVAMLAELETITDPAQRRRFAVGCVRALAGQVIAVRVRAWSAQPGVSGLALAAGFAVAVVDQASDTRAVMWMMLLAASALFAWLRPTDAWRWGLLLAIGIPLLAAARDGRGPYAFDRGDAMFGVPPAVLVAMVVGWFRRRLRPGLSAIIAFGTLTCATAAGAQSARAPHELTAADLEAFADSAFAEYLRLSPQPSLAFVVVKDSAIVFARGYGTEDAGGTRPVDPAATVFWMASLSKLVTADAVMREVDRGRVRLENPAVEYLDCPLPSRRGWRTITVEDLLTHTAGLDEPFMLGSEDDPVRLIPLGEYLRRIRWRAGTRPGDIVRYSNHGMALAGYIVERTSETAFADYVEREIFTPLGMTHSTFRQPVPAALAARIASAGTDVAADFVLPVPAGAMVGTAEDMGRFLIAQLDTSGPHAASLRAMHTTQWRAHPSVPGVALGWFETDLGGVMALYHTGARHHFSVAWLSPEHRVGLFLVHSMQQGGPFQNLRTDVVRAFIERYLVRDPVPARASTAPEAVDGVYRPAVLSTNTVERAALLFLDTPVRTTAPGSITMRAPGGLGVLTAHSIGGDAFEVRDGPQAGLRLGLVGENGRVERIAMGGTLLDPIVFTRLEWWQRGFVHAAFLATACVAIVIAAAARGVRRFSGRRGGSTTDGNPGWLLVIGAGTLLVVALLTFVATVVTTPEVGAAAHMRAGIRGVLAILSAAAVLCGALPAVTLTASWRKREPVRAHVSLHLLSLAGVVVAVLLWHYNPGRL